MFINLAYAMRLREMSDSEMAKQLDMDEAHFIDGKIGLAQFTRCERLAVALVLGYPTEWLFERI